MSSTPIQYTHKPDKDTLQEWRRRAMKSEDVFVGLLDDGSVEAKAERKVADFNEGQGTCHKVGEA